MIRYVHLIISYLIRHTTQRLLSELSRLVVRHVHDWKLAFRFQNNPALLLRYIFSSDRRRTFLQRPPICYDLWICKVSY